MAQSLIRTRIANLLLNFAISIETSCYVSILSEYSKVLIFNLKTLKQITVKQSVLINISIPNNKRKKCQRILVNVSIKIPIDRT